MYLVAKKAYLAFGIKIIYYNVIRKSRETEAELKATFYSDLATMLGLSDCIVLATPASSNGSKLIYRLTLSNF